MVSIDEATITQIAAVVDLVTRVLDDEVIGMYLYGSAVEGGLKPSSDVDLLAVSRRPTTPADRRGLIEALLPISGRRAADGPARPIELTIVSLGDVQPWRYPPPLDFQYGDWWRPEFERGELEPWTTPNADLTVLLAKVCQTGRPLVGPRPEAILGPIPPADLDRAMLDAIPELLRDLADDTRNIVLTLARIWMTRVTGEIVPKDVAADWVMARLPVGHRPVLAHAAAIYAGAATEEWSAELKAGVEPFAAHVIEQIRAARPAAAP